MRIDELRVLDLNFELRFLTLRFTIRNSKSILVIHITRTTTRIQWLHESLRSNFELTCYGSIEFDGIKARFGKTATVQARGKVMWSSVLLNCAPSSRIRDSPWMELFWTVDNGTALMVFQHKQMEYLIAQDHCKKNLSIWSKNEEVWSILVFVDSWEILENCDDLIWIFCEMKILLGLCSN